MAPLHPSPYYTPIGISSDSTASQATIKRAEQLESQSPATAFELYASVAAENREAGYRCALMLLEGRGTQRNFWQAYKYVKWAAVQGHAQANNVLVKIEKRMNWLLEISALLNTVDSYDNVSGDVQRDCRYAIMKLIFSDKNETLADNVIITHHDITDAMDDVMGYCLPMHDDPRTPELRRFLEELTQTLSCTELGQNKDESATVIMTATQQDLMIEKIMSAKKQNGKEGTEQRTITHHDLTIFVCDSGKRKLLTPVWLDNAQAIQHYHEHLMASLLTEGVDRYNTHQSVSIGIAAQESTMPNDVWGHIDNLLSLKTVLRLAATSAFHRSRHPQDGPWWQGKLKDGGKVSNAVPWFGKKASLQVNVPKEKIYFIKNPSQRKFPHWTADSAGKNYLKSRNLDSPKLLERIGVGQFSTKSQTVQLPRHINLS